MREMIKKLTPEWAKDIYRRMRAAVIRGWFAIFSECPIRKKRVVLANVWGYGDNPKWIAKALRAADKSLEIIFVTDTGRHYPRNSGITFVRTNSLRAVYYLATAHIWVDCNRKEPYITKRAGQYYIQTWHGSLPLKKIEKDCGRILGEEYLNNARRDSSMIDLALSDSEFFNDIYRNAFMYNGEIRITGSARLDPLFRPNPDRVNRLKRALSGKSCGNPCEYRKIAVYAPTFRGPASSFVPAEAVDGSRLLEALDKRFGGEFVLVMRLHPLDSAGRIPTFSERIIDGSRFGDLYEILEAADVLITDYSNTLFEFSYTGRPVFLLAPDADEYENDRGFYFDYAKLPYPHAADMDELTECIADYDAKNYTDGLNEFFRNMEIREDGHASSRIAKIIIKEVYGR